MQDDRDHKREIIEEFQPPEKTPDGFIVDQESEGGRDFRITPNILAKAIWNTNYLVLYEVKDKKFSLHDLPINVPFASQTFALSDNLFYLVGGFDPYFNHTNNKVWQYLSDSRKLTEKSPMIVTKALYSSVCTGKHILTIGGKKLAEQNSSRSEFLSSCEIYSSEKDQWRMLPNLLLPRANASTCLFGSRWVYAMGGETDANAIAAQSIERLDFMQIGNKSTSGWQQVDVISIEGMCDFISRASAH